jgi:putative membrane protein
MVITDIVYGIAALGVLGTGVLRVLYFGQGSSFYTENPLFWWKVGAYLTVGTLSLYPTITYILWAIPLRKGELPQVSESLSTRLKWILNIEILGFALIPLLAALMARGVGRPLLG